MRTKNYLYLILLILIGVSCKNSNINMLTIVNADGSCEKEFENNVDSRFMMGDSSVYPTSSFFPVKLDSTWHVLWQYNNGEVHTNFPLKSNDSIFRNNHSALKNDFDVKIRKHFASVEEMSKLDSVNQWNGQKIIYQLKKQFRWFYTYYKYTETYPKLKLAETAVPISKYMTKNEAKYWFNGSPNITEGMNGMEANDISKDLEKKFNTWLSNILWNEEFKIFVENYDKLSNPPVSQAQFSMLCDTIFEKKAKKMIDDENYDVDKILDDYFHTTTFSDFAQKNKSLLKPKNEDLLSLLISNTLNYSLQMPGKIVNGNFTSKNNHNLIWKVTSQRMFLQDFIIQAESRKSNWWAFLITILIIAGALGLLFFKKKD